jgi:hypothetical protein
LREFCSEHEVIIINFLYIYDLQLLNAMFSLINSTILIALSAIALPLIIHLINRQKKQHILYSSIRFLKFLEKKRIRKLSIYQYLLILIRTLIIIMIVLAFARPVYNNTNYTSASHAAVTSVIILDNGINMRGYDSGKRIFDQALDRLGDLISTYSSDDKVYIITASDLRQTTMDSLQIRHLTCTYSRAQFTYALKKARLCLKESPNLTKEIHVISDFSSVQKEFYDNCRSDSSTLYFLHKIGQDLINNVSIDSVSLSNQIIEQEKNVGVEVFIDNRSSLEREEFGVHIFSHGKRLAYQNVVLESFEKKTVVLKFRPPGKGFFDGYVEIPEDDLSEDNRFYFSFYIPDKIKVLFVDDSPSIYMQSAIQSIENTTDIKFVSDQYKSWGRQIFNDYDIIILANTPELTVPLRQRLKQYISDGGGLLIIPGDNSLTTALRDLSEEFKKIFHVGGLIINEDNSGFVTLDMPASKEPLFQDVFSGSESVRANPKFFRYYKLEAEKNSKVILRFRNRDPFFISGNYKKGFIGITASYFDNNWTDIQYSGIFSPLLLRIIYLGAAQSTNKVSWIKSGSDLKVEIPATSGSTFRISLPDQSAMQLIPMRLANISIFSLSGLVIPGNYYISSGKDDLHVISVNADNVGTPVTAYDIQSGAKGNVHIIADKISILSALNSYRKGMEFTNYIILVILFLFMIELYLIKRIEGKKGQNTFAGT